MSSEEEICRVCYDTKGDTPDMQFISPCSCMGDQLFIHKKCFNQWINTDRGSNSYTKCPTCKKEYLRNKPSDFSEKVEKKSLLVVLAISSSISLFFLTLMSGCISSSFFCIIAIILLYLLSFSYVSHIIDPQKCSYLYLILFMIILNSDSQIRLFTALILSIITLSLINYDLITNKWNSIFSSLSNEILKSFRSKFYDFHLKTFVDI